MLLGCICGGVIELLVFAVMSFVGPLLGTFWYNKRAKLKAKCRCECHEVHG